MSENEKKVFIVTINSVEKGSAIFGVIDTLEKAIKFCERAMFLPGRDPSFVWNEDKTKYSLLKDPENFLQIDEWLVDTRDF